MFQVNETLFDKQFISYFLFSKDMNYKFAMHFHFNSTVGLELMIYKLSYKCKVYQIIK